MKAVYLEAGKRPANRTGRRAELLRRIAAAAQRERLLVRVQEVVGGVLGLVGFLLLMGAGARRRYRPFSDWVRPGWG